MPDAEEQTRIVGEEKAREEAKRATKKAEQAVDLLGETQQRVTAAYLAYIEAEQQLKEAYKVQEQQAEKAYREAIEQARKACEEGVAQALRTREEAERKAWQARNEDMQRIWAVFAKPRK
jgi:predicted urease superfamily metal-dependent hydrolase